LRCFEQVAPQAPSVSRIAANCSGLTLASSIQPSTMSNSPDLTAGTATAARSLPGLDASPRTRGLCPRPAASRRPRLGKKQVLKLLAPHILQTGRIVGFLK
jgi:hypothetical protein